MSDAPSPRTESASRLPKGGAGETQDAEVAAPEYGHTCSTHDSRFRQFPAGRGSVSGDHLVVQIGAHAGRAFGGTAWLA